MKGSFCLAVVRFAGLACYASLFAATVLQAQEPTPKQPNVVLIFVDDMGYGDIGPFGATKYKTPHLDAMAREGVRFTDFYVAQPVCSASRAALLTGNYPNRIGIHGALGPKSKHGINPDEVTIAELFKSKGYSTAIFGKWHLGHLPEFLPTRHGFDEFYGIPYSNDMWPKHPEHPTAWGDLPTMDGEKVVGLNTDQSRFTTDFTRRTIDFIRRNSELGQSFFVYLAHPMPHVPLHVSEEREGKSGAGLYGDVIAEIDWSVGQIRNALRETGVEKDTLVFFISDNGPWLSYGNHGGSTGKLREGKGTVFEGGVRVPFLAVWPGILPHNATVKAPAMTIDLFPTLAQLIGADLPEREIDGKPMWKLLRGESNVSPQEAYYFYYNTNELHAMRSGKWKLHFPHAYRTMSGREAGKDGIPGKYDISVKTGLELYDLEADPSEVTNLADKHPEVVQWLSEMADHMREKLGDRLQGLEEGYGTRSLGQN